MTDDEDEDLLARLETYAEMDDDDPAFNEDDYRWLLYVLADQ